MTGVDAEHTKAQLLPDLPGCAHGIKGRDPWVVQCDGCGLTITHDGREPKPTFFQRIHFDRHDQYTQRLCQSCWELVIPGYDSDRR